MKNIEQILKDVGLEVTEEQGSAINKAVSENYKTVADYNKQVKKLEKAETDIGTLGEQINTANSTLEKFKDIDPEKIADEIAGYKRKAEEAETNAQKQIEARDQRDYLNAEFDKLGIKSERIRKSLMSEIMGDDGLKWKDGKYMGLSDYMASENEKDHFYETEEERKEAEEREEASGKAPKFTDKSEPKKQEPSDKPDVPIIF